MMTHWTTRRKASLAIHVAFVLVPFTLSTVSALLFWRAMFGGWWLAVPMVAVIEVLSLAGLVLFLTKIESPFVALRHLLPFISIVPLGRELYLLLRHNDAWVAWSLTVVATLVLVIIAWQCFRTIERLFIDPMEAAREKAHEQVAAFRLQLAQHEEMSLIVDNFVRERLDYHQGVAVTVSAPQPTTTQPTSLPALPLRPRVTGHVYILRSEAGQYKVGCSRELQRRIGGIAASLPFSVDLVHSIKTDDMERLERGLHTVYSSAQRRINGEWFHLSADDIAYLIGLGSELEESEIDSAIEGAVATVSTSPLPVELAATLEAKKRLAAQMRVDRKSWREIADAVGRSPSTVREWLAAPASNEDGTITLETIEVEGA